VQKPAEVNGVINMESVEEVNNVLYSGEHLVRFVEPITHGSQRSVVTTRMLYFAAIDAWRREGDREFTIDYWDVKFYSKKSGLYRKEGDDYKRLFEYVIHARDQVGHKKLDVVIKPRVRGMYYRSRKTGKFEKFKLPGEEGTLLFIQSSYMEWDEVLDLLKKIFECLDINTAYLAEIRVEDSKITTLERHVRVSTSVESPVADTLRAFEFWLRDQPGTKVKVRQDVEEDTSEGRAYVFYKVTFKKAQMIPERFQGLAFYVKMYRIREWKTANVEDNIKHSFKVEAGVDPDWSDERVPLEYEKELTDFLDRLVISILAKAGVQRGNLLGDDHFKPETRLEKEVELIDFPTLQELKGAFISRVNENEQFGEVLENVLARAVLKLVTLHGWVDLKKLAQELHYSERRIREIVKMLEELGLLVRVRTFGASMVQFRNTLLEEAVKSRIEFAEKTLGMGDAIRKVKEKALKRIKRRLTLLKKKLRARRIPFRFRIVAEAEVDAEHEDLVPLIETFLAKVGAYLNPYLLKEWERLLESLKAQSSASAPPG